MLPPCPLFIHSHFQMLKNETSSSAKWRIKKKIPWKGDWHFCNIGHPLLLISSSQCPSFIFLFLSAFSHLIPQTFPGPPAGGLTAPAGWECGWRTKAVELPRPVRLGCSTSSQVDMMPWQSDRAVHPSRSPSRATAARGAVSSHGGGSGQRMAEPELSPKG